MSLSILDAQTVTVECPNCRFETYVTLKEVRLQDAIICRGCKVVLRLEDYMGEMQKTQRAIDQSIRDFEQSLGNITLEF
jgi:hypothetical protein